MNTRMETILGMIEDGVGVIDVGTDHGYIPVSLAKNGYCGSIFASDIHTGPLDAARRAAENKGVADKISFLLCDGLSLCDPEEVDTIVIAGMGGDLICRILDQAEWTMDERYTMILQPMTKAEVLRYWLSNNEYGIVSEKLVQDSGRIYSVLTVRFGSNCNPLNDAELFTGSYEKVRQDPLFQPFLELLIAREKKVLSGIEEGGRDNQGRKRLYSGIINQMQEMQERENSTGNI